MELIMVAKSLLEPMAPPPSEAGIMELSLMLSRNQFDALEQRASEVGLSVAQFLRRLVHESTVQEVAGSELE
jgi:hypothetical protein